MINNLYYIYFILILYILSNTFTKYMSVISNFNLYLALYIFKFVLITVLIEPITSVVVVAPTWITSPYVQADSKRIINGDLCSCTTGSTTTPVPTGTLLFTTAFPSIPNLGYGISNYQGINLCYIL
jgi:hypothetical protein